MSVATLLGLDRDGLQVWLLPDGRVIGGETASRDEYEKAYGPIREGAAS